MVVVKEQPILVNGRKPRTGSLRLTTAVAPVLPPASDGRPPAPVTIAAVPAASNPLEIAEALVKVQQDAANDQMRSELLLMAREVARVGGETPPAAAAPDPTGT
jgi:hypothetical protein